MKKEPKIKIKKIPLGKKQLKVDFKDFFTAFTKAAIMYYTGKIDSAAKEIVGMIKSFTIKDEVSDLAYTLVNISLINATHELIEENKNKLSSEFTDPEKLYDNDDYVKFLDEISNEIEKKEYFLTLQNLRSPKKIALLKEYEKFLTKWLALFGLSTSDIKSLVLRFPAYFVFAMHSEWRSNHNVYEKILKSLDSPFSESIKEEIEWDNYFSFLEKQVDEPVFDESFSLFQIFVPLNAFYNTQPKKGKEKKKIPLVLKDELDVWIETADTTKAIKVISGGPGSGKSSFLKIWVSELAGNKNIKVLLIPLHLFNVESNLAESVGEYLRKDKILSKNPLESLDEERLLIVFDGLDELSQQGKVGELVAKDFVREIERNCQHYNRIKLRLFVLISGRELIIQSINSDFRKEKQILHLLPYYLPIDTKETFEKNSILKKDKRDDWWQNYGSLTGESYNGIPDFLKSNHLDEITAQPLLNYLVALSVKRGKLKFDGNTNLNEVYFDLIEGVHERAYEKREYESIRGLELHQFIRILEEIAIAAWHGGDVRTTTVGKIQDHIENSGLNPLFEIFKEGAKSGITRLLTAFYFRQTGIDHAGNKSFEFTHKSFGEYLTARRLVELSKKMASNLEQKRKDVDSGWDKRTALNKWLLSTGETTINKYLVSFILAELKLIDFSEVVNLQDILSDLFGFNLRKGFYFGTVRKELHEEIRLVRNAEESLFSLINCCALITERNSKINWGVDTNFAKFLSRMQQFRNGSYNCVAYDSLSFIDVGRSIIHLQDLYEANLYKSNLVQCSLELSILIGANLEEANLSGAFLGGANLIRVNLIRANLKGAILQEAFLREANLSGAILKGANLSGTNLSGANLSGANLERANLERANLEGVNLERANLEGVNLSGAILKGARLLSSDLTRANLKKSDLIGIIIIDEE